MPCTGGFCRQQAPSGYCEGSHQGPSSLSLCYWSPRGGRGELGVGDTTMTEKSESVRMPLSPFLCLCQRLASLAETPAPRMPCPCYYDAMMLDAASAGGESPRLARGPRVCLAVPCYEEEKPHTFVLCCAYPSLCTRRKRREVRETWWACQWWASVHYVLDRCSDLFPTFDQKILYTPGKKL